jgi:hypothetical protein
MEKFTLEQAKELAGQLKVDFTKAGFTAEEFLAGLHVELEYGLVDSHTNVTNDDPLVTAKIVLGECCINPVFFELKPLIKF